MCEEIKTVKEFRAFLLVQLMDNHSGEEFSEIMSNKMETLEIELKEDCLEFSVHVFAAMQAATKSNAVVFPFRISPKDMMVDLLKNAPKLKDVDMLVPINAIMKACEDNNFSFPMPAGEVTQNPIETH